MVAQTDLNADASQVYAHLAHITRRWGELGQPCLLETVFLNSDDVAIVKDVRRFEPTAEGLEEAAQHVVAMNRYRLNAYAVVNPVDATKPIEPGKRAKAEHIAAAFFHWADADSAQAAQNIKTFVGPKSTFYVITGTQPTTRPHVYWELEEPARNLAAWSETQRAIAATLGTDPAVIDAPRIMRIGGTINWPKPKKVAKGYAPEVTRLHIHDAQERPPVSSERMARAFAGSAASAPHSAATGYAIDTGEHHRTADEYAVLLRRAQTDGEKHAGVRDLAASLAGQGVKRELTEAIIRNACPVWDANVETLIASAYAKFWREPEARQPIEAPQRIDGGSAFFPASDLDGRPIPPREWHVPEMIPAHTVTMLGGDGGTGKSLLALQLAVATALGAPWLGIEVKRGPAILFSAEDDIDELHRRLADVARAYGARLADLSALSVRSFAGEDALLAILDRKTNTLAETPLLHELDAHVAEWGAVLAVFDTLADLHSGQENERTHARQVISILRGLSVRHRCTSLLLAHPSLTGMSSGSGLSGSTGWNNSVRSRLYLDRVKDEDGMEPDPFLRKLAVKKTNYGPGGNEITMRWNEGAFIPEANGSAPGMLDRIAASSKAERVFMKLLRAFSEEGRTVSPHSGRSFAPFLFARDPRSEGVTRRGFETAMSSLFAAGKVRVERTGPASRSVAIIVESHL